MLAEACLAPTVSADAEIREDRTPRMRMVVLGNAMAENMPSANEALEVFEVPAVTDHSIRCLLNGREENGCVAFCATAAEFTDKILFAILDSLTEMYSARIPWDEIPDVSLITARDETALRHVSRRVFGTDRILGTGHGGITLLDCHARGFQATRRTIGRGDTTETSTSASMITALSSKSAGVAIITHGVEGCARGDPDTVLCGRTIAAASSFGDQGIRLGCAEGGRCPRAPSQLPLSSIRTPILFMASCGSLRLADAFVSRKFNLALEYLDGDGLGYVGAVASSQGHVVASTAFCAALAAGYGLGRAVHWANAAVAFADLERPPYLPVGHPNLAIVSPNGRIVYALNGATLGIARTIGCGNSCCAEVVVDAPELIELADCLALGVEISSNQTMSIYTFYRVEMTAAHERDAERSLLRIFIFTFPHGLDSIEITFHDRLAAETSLIRCHHAVDRWSEFILQLPTNDSKRAENESLAQLALQFQKLTGVLLAQPPTDTSRLPSIRAHEARLLSTIDLMRETTIDTIGPLLHGAFWLPNVMMRSHRPVGHARICCPDCGGIAIKKILRHTMRATDRVVIVCPRCVIASDRAGASVVRDILFREVKLTADHAVEGLIEVSVFPGSDSLQIVACLSTPNGQEIADAVPIVCDSFNASGTSRIPFRFELKAPIVNHFYFIKLFADTHFEFLFRSFRFELRSS
jgi:hypothetical protein